MVYDVYLMRHGRAESGSFAGDAERRLTADGEAGIHNVARALKAMGVRADALWHSPFTRAAQTAAIVGDTLGLNARIVDDGLTPGGAAAHVAEKLRDADKTLFVVSHLPLLPAVVSALLDAPCPMNVTPGTVLHMTLVGRRAGLSGAYSAAALEALGAGRA